MHKVAPEGIKETNTNESGGWGQGSKWAFSCVSFSISFWHFCCSVIKSCLTLCYPMDCSTPGFPLLYYLPEFAQTHVHWVSDAIQPSHPLSPPSPAFNLSQHQSLFHWISSSHQVAKNIGLSASASIFPMNIQGWFPLGLTGLISLLSKGLSRVYSSITVQKYQFLQLWACQYSSWLQKMEINQEEVGMAQTISGMRMWISTGVGVGRAS